MKRREVIVLLILISTLIAINAVNFIRKEKLRQSTCLVTEEGKLELSLNRVSVEELCDLPGIGPVLAERIIRYREQRGRFESLDELKRIKGIGDKLYNKISPYVKL
ncbi:MAG: helix-hairpin-helix domain-containing protein [bacterium]